jgi:hypothetical protein
MQTYVHLSKYLTQFFLEWEMFHTKVVEKVKTHILCSITFPKLCCLWDNVKKCGRARQATDDNTVWCMHFACWIIKARDTHSKYVLLLFHGNNGYANVPWCYIFMPVLFKHEMCILFYLWNSVLFNVCFVNLNSNVTHSALRRWSSHTFGPSK